MKLTFLPSALNDLLWFRSYYSVVFPEGELKAKQQLAKIGQLLEANPYLGQVGLKEGTRRMVIPKTPFTLIYRVTAEEIEVLRLRDQRQSANDQYD